MLDREFTSLEQFSRFMIRAVVFERVADLAARAAVGEFFVKEIKDRLGKPELLPPPLAESTQAERSKAGFTPDETLLRTGELRDSIGMDQPSPRKTIVASSSMKAVWHELGPNNGRFPARSFFAATVNDKNEEAFAIYLEAFNLAFRPR